MDVKYTDLVVIVEADGQNYKLDEPFIVQMSDGESFTVPAGFETNFASSPRFMWSIFPPEGVYTRAAAVHDFLYTTHPVTRAQADAILLELMLNEGTPMWKARPSQ